MWSDLELIACIREQAEAKLGAAAAGRSNVRVRPSNGKLHRSVGEHDVIRKQVSTKCLYIIRCQNGG